MLVVSTRGGSTASWSTEWCRRWCRPTPTSSACGGSPTACCSTTSPTSPTCPTALELSTDDVDRLRRNLAVQLGPTCCSARRRTVRRADRRGAGRAGAARPPARGGLRRVPAARRGRRRRGGAADVGTRIVVVDGPTHRCRRPGHRAGPRRDDRRRPDARWSPRSRRSTPATMWTPGPSRPARGGRARRRRSPCRRVGRRRPRPRVGRVATVLATVDAVPGGPTIGQYGSGDGADRLLPPAAGDG